MDKNIPCKHSSHLSPQHKFKQLFTKNQFRSPKFLRKQDNKINSGANREKRVELKEKESEVICYISPKKISENKSFGIFGSKAVTWDSTSNITQEDSYKRLSQFQPSYKGLENKQQSQIQVSCYQAKKRIEVNNKAFGEENIDLKFTKEKLQKQLQQEKYINQCLKKENAHLYSNIEQLKTYLSHQQSSIKIMNQKIKELEKKIKEKQQDLDQYQEALKDQRQNVTNLELIIETINKSTFDKSYQQTFENISESTEDDVQEMDLQFYKSRVIELNELLKYAQIHESILPFLRAQLNDEKEKNKNLKNLNNKYKAKITNLLQDRQHINIFNLRTSKKKLKDDEISLEFSPEK